MSEKKIAKINFEKRLYVGIFTDSGIDYSDLPQLAQRIKNDFEVKMAPSKFNISVEEGADEGEPKIKIEAKNDSISMWGNEEMIFFSSYDNDKKGIMGDRYRQIIELLSLDVFKDIKVTGFRVSVRAAVELDRNAQELGLLMRTIVNGDPENDNPYAVSNQYTIRVDDEHRVEYKVTLSEVDDTDLAEFTHSILHSVHYEKTSKANKLKMIKSLGSIEPEKEIDNEVERSRKAITL